jgi:hypothetical protein
MTLMQVGLVGLVFVAGVVIGNVSQAQKQPKVYELRTYYTLPGRLDALNSRFRNHTTKLFEKHGMNNIVYGVPTEEPKKSNMLIYLLSHESEAAAKKSWDAFRADPDWVKARTDSEKDGKIVDRVESVFLNPTDFSPMK